MFSNTFKIKDMSILSIPTIWFKKKKSEGASGHCFQPKTLGTFAKLILQCLDRVQCPLPDSHFTPSQLRDLPKQLKLGRRDKHIQVSTEWPPIRSSLIQIECSVYMCPENVCTLNTKVSSHEAFVWASFRLICLMNHMTFFFFVKFITPWFKLLNANDFSPSKPKLGPP